MAAGLGLLGPAPAMADSEFDLTPYAGFQLAYVDNPFFDPIDPTAIEVSGVPSTLGDSAEFDLRGGARAVWRALSDGRLEVSAYGRWSTWAGAAATSGWDAGLNLTWVHRLAPALDLTADAVLIGAAVEAFPTDDLRWYEARLGARVSLGDHRIEASLGAALRVMPDRVVDFDTGETGLDDALVRGRLAAYLSPGAGVTLAPTYLVDLSRTVTGTVEHDTHTLALGASRTILDVDVDVGLAGWLRDFSPVGGQALDRLDLGVAADVGVGRLIWPGVRLSGRYRYVRSTSDDPFGQYAQHFAGLELFAWYDGWSAPAHVAPRLDDASPIEVSGGWLFRHRAPEARRVSLVGDFNDWSVSDSPLAGPDEGGWWSITVPLEPGRHGYMFVVDGQQFVRPDGAPRYADDGFGGEVGVLFVMPEPSERAER